MSDDPNKGADDPNNPKPQPDPNPAPTPTPTPEPAKDEASSAAHGRVHVIGPGEVVIDGRAGF
jgi:hypothetical protein